MSVVIADRTAGEELRKVVSVKPALNADSGQLADYTCNQTHSSLRPLSCPFLKGVTVHAHAFCDLAEPAKWDLRSLLWPDLMKL